MRSAACALLLVAAGCVDGPGDDSNVVELLSAASPDGRVVATVTEMQSAAGGVTQVFLSFHQGRCGAGAVSAATLGAGLNVVWRANRILAIEYPPGLQLDLNASGSEIQCGEERVAVVLVEKDYPEGPLPGCLTLELDSLETNLLEQYPLPRRVQLEYSAPSSEARAEYRALGDGLTWGGTVGLGRLLRPDSLILSWSDGYVVVGFRLEVRGMRALGSSYFDPDDDLPRRTANVVGLRTTCW